MWCDRNRERHTVSSSGGNRLPNPVLTVLSVTSQIRAFSVLPVRRLRRSMGIFSVATIVCSWLTYQSQRAEPAGEFADRRAFSPPSSQLFRSVVSGSQAAQTDTEAQAKNPPRQRQCFINACSGVPQCGQQHLAVQIRDVMEQGTHFRSQQIFWQFIMDHRHLAKCQSCRIINGNRQRCRLPGRIHCRYHDCRLAVYNGA